MSINVSRRNIGINFLKSGEAEIVVWAPLAKDVEIQTGRNSIRLKNHDHGYWNIVSNDISPGTSYKIAIDGNAYPDPASLSQARGVHEDSVALDLNAFMWTDTAWKNIPLSEYIMYELHTGTFSAENSFAGIKNKLGYLTELGITAIEVMPVGQFPGNRNWGYDGVYPFAVQHSYGGASGLQELVNACHQHGIAVILDVIYNHLGPEGNYLSQFGPYFTEKYKTPWGKSLNFDDAWCDGVRKYFIENALMWFRDFHIDALRMDAVHAIRDFSPDHIIKEIKQHVEKLTQLTGRPYYLIAEIDLNDPVFINSQDKCGYGCDAQWIDEFHHALRVASGQKREGYYADFNGIGHLAKSYKDAYVYDGQFSEHRKKIFGAKTSNPGHQFVVFSQNHDQTGNRMLGERTSQLVSFEMCKLMAAAVMISPYLPMLFMGEEWAESNPFLFFIDHTDKELAAKVNKGRKEEFAYFNWESEPPDPRMEETFQQSMLQWDLIKKEPHQAMFRYYKKLIELRKTQPALMKPDRNTIKVDVNESIGMMVVSRRSEEQQLVCEMNFSDKVQSTDIKPGYKIILDSASPEWGGPKGSENNLQPQSILIYESN